MKRALWGLALVSVLLPVGMAAAQTAPASTAVAAPAKAAPAPVKAAAASAKVDLAQIFAAPAGEGNSTKAIALTPEPLWKNCTIGECRDPCVLGCEAQECGTKCDSFVTCSCSCACP
jgi:hypothetical protein